MFFLLIALLSPNGTISQMQYGPFNTEAACNQEKNHFRESVNFSKGGSVMYMNCATKGAN